MEGIKLSLWQKIFPKTHNENQAIGSILEVAIGDTLSHNLIDYIVVGHTIYSDDSGSRWHDYRLEGDGETWLVFDEDTQAAIIYKTLEMDLPGEPPPEIIYQGRVYKPEGVGQARVIEAKGETLKQKGQHFRYWHYEKETGGYVIFVEDQDGRLQAGYGYYIMPHELSLSRRLRAIYQDRL